MGWRMLLIRFARVVDEFIKALLFWNFLIYPTMSRAVLGYFDCDFQVLMRAERRQSFWRVGWDLIH